MFCRKTRKLVDSKPGAMKVTAGMPSLAATSLANPPPKEWPVMYKRLKGVYWKAKKTMVLVCVSHSGSSKKIGNSFSSCVLKNSLKVLLNVKIITSSFCVRQWKHIFAWILSSGLKSSSIPGLCGDLSRRSCTYSKRREKYLHFSSCKSLSEVETTSNTESSYKETSFFQATTCF